MKLIIKTILFWVLITSTAVFAELAKVKVNGFDIEYEMVGSGKHTVLLEAGGSAGLSLVHYLYRRGVVALRES